MDSQIKTISKWLGAGSINIFGRPFSGKDTQGRKLAEMLGAALIGGGDILRSHRDPEKVKQVLDAGGLIPSDFYFEMILPYLSKEEFKGRPLILDSVGRSHGEEPTIMKAAEHSGHPLKAVVYLELQVSETWKRFEAAKEEKDRGARADDKHTVLENRLSKFHNNTLPVIEYYRKNGLLIEVDGAPSREEVTREIIKALVSFAKM